jgi:hypothetical protein
MRWTWKPGIRLEVVGDFRVVDTGPEHRQELTTYDRATGQDLRLGNMIHGFCADPTSDGTGWLRITVERADDPAGELGASS